MANSRVSDQHDSRFPYLKSQSFHYHKPEAESPPSWNSDFGIGDRRLAFSRQTSFHQSAENDSVKPMLSRTASSIDILQDEGGSVCREEKFFWGEEKVWEEKFSVVLFVSLALRIIRSGNRPMRRLLVLIFLNVAYSTAELCIGLLSGRIGMIQYHQLYYFIYINSCPILFYVPF